MLHNCNIAGPNVRFRPFLMKIRDFRGTVGLDSLFVPG
jgi:hypothetical protein